MEAKHQKYKGRVVLRGVMVKDEYGCHIQIAWLRRTSSWRSICLYPGKWTMLPNYWKFPNRNVETFGFVYQDTNGLNHGPVWKTQSFLLIEIFMVILWQDYYGKGNLRKSSCSTVGRRFLLGNAYSYTVKKRVMWMTTNWLERSKTLIRCGKYSIKKSIGRTNIFPWSCILGLHSKTMWHEQRYW